MKISLSGVLAGLLLLLLFSQILTACSNEANDTEYIYLGLAPTPDDKDQEIAQFFIKDAFAPLGLNREVPDTIKIDDFLHKDKAYEELWEGNPEPREALAKPEEYLLDRLGSDEVDQYSAIISALSRINAVAAQSSDPNIKIGASIFISGLDVSSFDKDQTAVLKSHIATTIDLKEKFKWFCIIGSVTGEKKSKFSSYFEEMREIAYLSNPPSDIKYKSCIRKK